MRAFSRTALLLAAAFPISLRGQGLTIQSIADVRLFGALGTVASIAGRFGGGGNMHDLATTKYLTRTKLRTESGTMGTIIDLDAERLISIDNKEKTFSSVTFAEMAEAMRQAQEQAKQQMQQQKAERAKADEARAEKGKAREPNDSIKLSYKVSVDRPGERAKIAGYDAERMFMTITIEAEAKKEGGDTEKVGDLVLLLDQWISKDAPQGAAFKEFQKAYAQKAGRAFQAQAQGLQSVFASDPRIKEGMEAAAKEMQKVEGIPLRSMTYVALVPPGLTFDRQLVLEDAKVAAAKDDKSGKEEKPKGGGFKGLMGKIKSAAEESNKPKAEEDKSAPPKQATLMSIKDEVQSITTGVPADIFTPPAGYREVKMRGMPER